MPETTLQEIADAVDALCDPTQHTETVHRDGADDTEPHRTVKPGLIAQLREAAEPGNDGGDGGRGGRESVPVAIDAVSLLRSIEFGAAKRVHDAIRCGVRVESRDNAEGNLRALVGIAGQFTHGRTRRDPYVCPGHQGVEHWMPCHACHPTTQSELRSELKSWVWQAEIITGWRTAPVPLLAPCLNCDARGTLTATPDPANATARCSACDAVWCEDPGEREGAIGILARHVSDYQDMSLDDRREHRRQAVEARQRAEGKPRSGAA